MGKKKLKLAWHTEKRKINDLIPFERNPRLMTKKEARDLEESLEKFNLVEIPAINTDDMIIAGHQRLKLLQLKGRGGEEIDVRVPNRKLTKAELKEYNVRSNKNRAGWDWDMLANDYDIGDLLKYGFKEEELPFDKDYGETFSLRSGDKDGFQQITFTLADEQAELIKKAIKKAKPLGLETYKNENSNGNALYWIAEQWITLKK